MVSVPKASHRGRAAAYEPLLGAALNAGRQMLFRGRQTLRPPQFTEGRRALRLTSKTDRSKVNTGSIGAQLEFTGGAGGGFPSEVARPPLEPGT